MCRVPPGARHLFSQFSFAPPFFWKFNRLAGVKYFICSVPYSVSLHLAKTTDTLFSLSGGGYKVRKVLFAKIKMQNKKEFEQLPSVK
jgi:hypothetical protein